MNEMRKYHPPLRRSRHRIPGYLVILLAFLFDHGWGQQTLWEQLITRGNQALAEGALFKAETSLLEALQVADGFAPQDLRRSTTQRNLAQVLMLQGRFATADSLYRQAILTATATLEPGHPYVLSLRDELRRLREAAARIPAEPETTFVPTTFTELVDMWVNRLVGGSILQFGPTMPLNSELVATNDRGLGYGLNFHWPLQSQGLFSLGVEVDRTVYHLPPKRTLDVPLELRGTTLAAAPALGPVSLLLGIGVFGLTTDSRSATRLGLTGGIRLALKGRRHITDEMGLQAGLRIRTVYLPNADPASQGAAIILQAGMDAGWRW